MGRSINAGTGKLVVATKNAELQQKCRKFLLKTPILIPWTLRKAYLEG
jgi:ribosomal protein L24E